MSLRLNDIVGIWDGTHLTKMKVVKINRVTFDCIEIEKSHVPGRKWRVHKSRDYVIYNTDGLVYKKNVAGYVCN